MARLSDVAVLVRPGRARRVVLVRLRRGRQWSARPELCAAPYSHGRLCLVAVGYSLRRACFGVVRPVAACPPVRLLCCSQDLVWLAVVFAA